MQILDRAISVLAPHNCLICDTEGALLCAWCLPDAVQQFPERCYKCKQVSEDSAVCLKCRSRTKLRHVWVRTTYDGLAKDLIYKFKFDRAQTAYHPIAELMNEALPWLTEDTLVVHVPTATSRHRKRGYDHAQLLAKQLARINNLRQIALLSRLGQSRQVGATRSTRLSQLEEAFIPRRPYLIKGANILIVDDIMTSGGTLEAAAKTLKKAGAKSVNAIVFAQKQ